MDNGTDVYECKAKGVFRNKKIKPLVGDNVEFTVLSEAEKEGNIDKILPRKNELVRPAVANVDQALVIFSITHPEPNLNLLDRFLVMMEVQDVPVKICFNKTDLTGDEERDRLGNIYSSAGYPVYFTSTYENRGLEAVRELTEGKTTRGKHTTRHSELFAIGKDTYMMDTPGFSSMYLEELECGNLKDYFPEFAAYEEDCKFLGCVHVGEPVCGVKEAVRQGGISESRYDNYKLLYQELKDKRRY